VVIFGSWAALVKTFLVKTLSCAWLRTLPGGHRALNPTDRARRGSKHHL